MDFTKWIYGNGLLMILAWQASCAVQNDAIPITLKTNASFPVGMVLIPAGEFTMGDSFKEGQSNERPAHIVNISAFCIDKYEVTKALWDDVFQWSTNHGYKYDCNGTSKATNHPIHTVTWHDVVKWCNARSEKEGIAPAYYTSLSHTTVYRFGQVHLENAWVKWETGYRLPTEAEWEKAARGGLNGKRFPWGDTIKHSQANYQSSTNFAYDVSNTHGNHPDYKDQLIPYTSPVGSFASNNYGLHDMAGGVFEWCWDWYSVNYYASSSKNDPRGPALGTGHVLRGGGWDFTAFGCRTAFRSGAATNLKHYGFGFRTVMSQGQK